MTWTFPARDDAEFNVVETSAGFVLAFVWEGRSFMRAGFFDSDRDARDFLAWLALGAKGSDDKDLDVVLLGSPHRVDVGPDLEPEHVVRPTMWLTDLERSRRTSGRRPDRGSVAEEDDDVWFDELGDAIEERARQRREELERAWSDAVDKVGDEP